MDYTSLGRTAFNAYRQARGSKAYDATDIPTWENVKPEIADAWMSAAEAVCHELYRQGSPKDQSGIVTFWVTSGYGYRTQKPFVQVLIESADFMTQMSPAEAKDLAQNLLTCAEAAESDAFLVTFLRSQIKAEDRAIAAILNDFREWRTQQRTT